MASRALVEGSRRVTLKTAQPGSLGLACDDRRTWAIALTHTALFPFEKSWIIEAKQLSS